MSRSSTSHVPATSVASLSCQPGGTTACVRSALLCALGTGTTLECVPRRKPQGPLHPVPRLPLDPPEPTSQPAGSHVLLPLGADPGALTTVAPTPILRKAANVSFAPLPTSDSRSTSYVRISTPGLATAPRSRRTRWTATPPPRRSVR